jgi:hypothetical protein
MTRTNDTVTASSLIQLPALTGSNVKIDFGVTLLDDPTKLPATRLVSTSVSDFGRIVAAIALAFLAFGATTSPGAQAARALVVCGWDEVFVLDPDRRDAAGRPVKTWTWRAKGRADLPDDIEPRFNTTDECKPLDGGSKILITSSGGAAALVDRTADRVLFYGRAANAHSAERLPSGRIVVAASHDPAGLGDRLFVFDQSRSDHPLSDVPLPWAHGAVWDESGQTLWALGEHDLRTYRLANWNSAQPRLELQQTYMLPDPGGHDLIAVPGSPLLTMTTNAHVWSFDRDTRQFAPHASLADLPRVKGVSVLAASRAIVYVQAEGTNWWAERIHLRGPEAVVHLPGERLYKARWVE